MSQKQIQVGIEGASAPKSWAHVTADTCREKDAILAYLTLQATIGVNILHSQRH